MSEAKARMTYGRACLNLKKEFFESSKQLAAKEPWLGKTRQEQAATERHWREYCKRVNQLNKEYGLPPKYPET